MRLFSMLLLGAAAVAIAERVPAAADGAVCVVYMLDSLPEYSPNISSVRREDTGDHDHFERLECWFDDFEMLEIINADSKVMLEIESGVTRIYVAASERERGVVDMSSKKVHILPQSPIMMAKSRENQVAASSGLRTVVIVRVNGKDQQNAISANEMYRNVFADNMNPAKGFNDCSGGKFRLTPYQGNNVFNGVITVNLNQNVKSKPSREIQTAVMRQLPQFQDAFVMYMLPSDVDFGGAAAYAYVNGYLSVYKGRYGSHHMVLMHELGHNIGQLHSGKDGSSYADRTCHMGNSLFADDAPQACFNGAKSWYLGWYTNGHVTRQPGSGRVAYDVVSFDDYVGGRSQSGQKTIVKLPDSDTDYYIMYNRAKGINSQVQGAADQVTITSQRGATAQSWHIAALQQGASYSVPNYRSSGKPLVITVCKLVRGTNNDYARVAVGLSSTDCNPSPPPPPPPPPPPANFRPTTRDQLKAAVDAWCAKINPWKYNRVEDISQWDISQITAINQLFAGMKKSTCKRNLAEWKGLRNWNVGNVRNFIKTFKGSDIQISINLDKWDVRNAETMFQMFWGVRNWKGWGTASWKPEKCMNFQGMFNQAKEFITGIRWTIRQGAITTNMFDEGFSGAKPNGVD